MQARTNKQRVVIIGGGVVGCATAFDCVQAGYDVTLVERDSIAAHASGKNAGNLNPLIGTAPGQISLTLEAFQRQAEIHAALQTLGCADYARRPVKRIHLGFQPSDHEELQQIAVACQADANFTASWLDRGTLHALEPRLAPAVEFGLMTEGSLSVSGAGFTRALAHGAARLGAKIIIGNVTGITCRDHQAVMVETTAGPAACDALILATGPFVAETKTWLSLTIPVAPVKGQMLLMRLAGDPLAHDFTWQSLSLYNRQNGELWVGGTMEHRGFDSTPTDAAKTMLLEQAARILPAIKQAVLLDHTAAFRPMTESGACIASHAPGWRNVYLANGGGAKGILLSVAIAQRVRQILQQDHAAI